MDKVRKTVASGRGRQRTRTECRGHFSGDGKARDVGYTDVDTG